MLVVLIDTCNIIVFAFMAELLNGDSERSCSEHSLNATELETQRTQNQLGMQAQRIILLSQEYTPYLRESCECCGYRMKS